MRPIYLAGLCPCLLLLACAEGEPKSRTPWSPDTANVIGNASGDTSSFDWPGGDECFVPPDAPDGYCLQPQNECEEGGAADLIVDADGELLDVVCLPPEIDHVEALDLEDGEIAQTSNNTALVFEGGEVFEGDLSVDGNNVVLYGDSPAEAVIDGDLTVTGNNTIIRGVTIAGNAEIVKNNTVMVYCVIEGDLIVTANNSKVSGCDVFGNVVITGNNTQLNGVFVQGELTVEGQNTVCDGVQAFGDDNEDGVVDEAEISGPIDC